MQRRLSLSFTLILLLLSALCGAVEDYRAMHHAVDAAVGVESKREALRSIETSDVRLRSAVHEALTVPQDRFQEKYTHVKSMLDLRVVAMNGQQPTNASAQIRQIKNSPFYHDPGVKSDNWISEAIKKLPNLFRSPAEVQPREINGPNGDGLKWLVYAVIFLLAAGILGFLAFALSKIRLRNRTKRASKAVLDEEEPERSLDEWLALADDLVAQGRHREAVRCLYLACLMRFDEARVARFERGETNWEHLARIQSSPRRPAELDFLPMTKAFDQIWYGMVVRGIEDVDQFRHWYREITVLLTGANA